MRGPTWITGGLLYDRSTSYSPEVCHADNLQGTPNLGSEVAQGANSQAAVMTDGVPVPRAHVVADHAGYPDGGEHADVGNESARSAMQPSAQNKNENGSLDGGRCKQTIGCESCASRKETSTKSAHTDARGEDRLSRWREGEGVLLSICKEIKVMAREISDVRSGMLLIGGHCLEDMSTRNRLTDVDVRVKAVLERMKKVRVRVYVCLTLQVSGFARCSCVCVFVCACMLSFVCAYECSLTSLSVYMVNNTTLSWCLTCPKSKHRFVHYQGSRAHGKTK
jgi:hypothetical protein